MTPIQAKELCIEAHKDQTRHDGTPYHTHPIAVANMMTTDEEKIVAYLHDVIEGTNITIKNLTDKGYSYKIVKAIQRLTKKFEQSYTEYLLQVSADNLATKVKIVDMFHNISDSPTEAQRKKYYSGIKYLLESL